MKPSKIIFYAKRDDLIKAYDLVVFIHKIVSIASSVNINMKIYLISNENNIHNMTTSWLEFNESKILHTATVPMWRWILSYNIQSYNLFTIKHTSTVYNNETIKI